MAEFKLTGNVKYNGRRYLRDELVNPGLFDDGTRNRLIKDGTLVRVEDVKVASEDAEKAAKAKADSIVKDAQAKAKKIREEAKAEAKQVREAAQADAKKPAEAPKDEGNEQNDNK